MCAFKNKLSLGFIRNRRVAQPKGASPPLVVTTSKYLMKTRFSGPDGFNIF